MDRDQAPRNVGPNLRSILFDTRHQNLLKTGCIAWNYLKSEVIEILSILQIAAELLEGTVCRPDRCWFLTHCLTTYLLMKIKR